MYVSVNGPAGTLKNPSLTVPRTADPSGRVDGSWTSPTDAAVGAYQIVIQSDHSGVTRTIPVTIHAAQAGPPPQLTVTPAAAAPGARFVFSGSGFGANEKLSIWLNAPDGRVLPAEIEGIAETAPDGRVGWTWVAPQGCAAGRMADGGAWPHQRDRGGGGIHASVREFWFSQWRTHAATYARRAGRAGHRVGSRAWARDGGAISRAGRGGGGSRYRARGTGGVRRGREPGRGGGGDRALRRQNHRRARRYRRRGGGALADRARSRRRSARSAFWSTAPAAISRRAAASPSRTTRSASRWRMSTRCSTAT